MNKGRHRGDRLFTLTLATSDMTEHVQIVLIVVYHYQWHVIFVSRNCVYIIRRVARRRKNREISMIQISLNNTGSQSGVVMVDT